MVADPELHKGAKKQYKFFDQYHVGQKRTILNSLTCQGPPPQDPRVRQEGPLAVNLLVPSFNVRPVPTDSCPRTEEEVPDGRTGRAIEVTSDGSVHFRS